MRLLVTTNLWPTDSQPELGTFVASQVRELRRLGVDVDVLAIDNRVASKALRYSSLGYQSIRSARHGDYDIIACHIAFPTGILGWLAARMPSARLVLHAHGSDVMSIPSRSRAHWRAAGYVFRAADHVVANSNYLKAKVVSRFNVPQTKISVVSPGIDSQFFTGSEVARANVIYAGRFVKGKGVDLLIRAFAESRQSYAQRLVLIGQGSIQPDLERLARELAVPIDWRGPIPRAAVAQALRTAAVVAVPSTLPEGLGLSALEGLASGAIVVASNAGALADTIIEGRSGFSAAVGSVPALADAIDRALCIYEEPSRRESVVAAGLRVAAAHQGATAAAALLRVYEGLIEG